MEETHSFPLVSIKAAVFRTRTKTHMFQDTYVPVVGLVHRMKTTLFPCILGRLC